MGLTHEYYEYVFTCIYLYLLKDKIYWDLSIVESTHEWDLLVLNMILWCSGFLTIPYAGIVNCKKKKQKYYLTKTIKAKIMYSTKLTFYLFKEINYIIWHKWQI